ncbi:MAG TPA: hypothetical protein VNE63_19855 [Candidatus Acidoferrales bacterium]|nr:hypothetical protein [Candidatus Acidoferrales bacterium]
MRRGGRWHGRGHNRGGSRGLDLRRGLGRFGGRFCGSESQEVLPHKFCVVDIKGTGVRLFFRDAYFRKILDQDFGLDLKLTGQLIDANLIGI